MLRMRSGVSKRLPITERKTRFDGTVQEFACQVLAIEPGKHALIRYDNVGLVDEISETRVAWRDLIVDVLVKPDGAIDILDEDELPADLPSEHRATIARALEQIVTNPKRLVAEIERETRAAL